jgi:hypothetical protein
MNKLDSDKFLLAVNNIAKENKQQRVSAVKTFKSLSLGRTSINC